ncbi:hypothetical protein FBU30_003843, partial [Linnemannia zychae]
MDSQETLISDTQSEDLFNKALEDLTSSLRLCLAELPSSDTKADGAPEMELDSEPDSENGEETGSESAPPEGETGDDNCVQSASGKDPEEFPVSQGVIERQSYSAAHLEQNVIKTIRDSLFDDPFIIETAEKLGFPEHERIVMKEKNGCRYITFYLISDFFKDWLKRHEECLDTRFTQHKKPHPFSTNVKESSSQQKKDKAGQTVYRYSCHCKSKKYERKGRIKGGKTGKTRARLPSISCNCCSSIAATFRPRETSDGKPGNTYKVEYYFQHNHLIGAAENIGTMRLSEVIKKRIKAMIMRGMSIQAIMTNLTVDHAKFTRFLEGEETLPLSRDNFITYDDVYNILHAITAKEVRKHNDEAVSARLWMEELDRAGYFTFCDNDNDLFHGFSSPWQLDQLRKWGDVLCFDGTHHARGYGLWDSYRLPADKDAEMGAPEELALEAESKDGRDIRDQLQAILYAPKEEEANSLLSEFRNEWQDEASGLV